MLCRHKDPKIANKDKSNHFIMPLKLLSRPVKDLLQDCYFNKTSNNTLKPRSQTNLHSFHPLQGLFSECGLDCLSWIGSLLPRLEHGVSRRHVRLKPALP